MIRNFNQRSGTFLFGMVALGATGCVLDAGGEQEAVAREHHAPLYGNPHPNGPGYWNSVEGATAYIPVCWTANAVQGKGGDGVTLPSPFPGLTNVKKWMKEFIENEWTRASNIYFTGWDNTCVTGGVSDNADRALNPNTLLLSFHTVAEGGLAWSTDVNGRGAIGENMIRIDWTATDKSDYAYPSIHEAGHALGFDHEQNRPDNFAGNVRITCLNSGPNDAKATAGTAYTTFVDKQSVMCYDVTPSTLSPGDIMGIQRRYGRKPKSSIVGWHGMCANVIGGSPTNGAMVGSWPCTAGTNDTWFRPNSSSEQIRSNLSNKCMRHVSGDIVSSDCATEDAQRFVFGHAGGVGAELRGLGNLCVDVLSNVVQLQTCDGSSSQRWDLQHVTGTQRWDQIRWVGGTNKCLSSSTTGGAVGETLLLATCSSTDTKQRFSYPGNGIIKMTGGDFCLNSAGGLPTPGAEVSLWNGCNPTATPQNEQFFVRGRIRTVGGLCLAYESEAQWGGPNGDRIITRPCFATAPRQIWDFYL